MFFPTGTMAINNKKWKHSAQHVAHLITYQPPQTLLPQFYHMNLLKNLYVVLK